MSANVFAVAVISVVNREVLTHALIEGKRFSQPFEDGFTDSRHPGVWLEVEGPGHQIHDGPWTIFVFPDEDLVTTRRVAHEVAALLHAASVEAFVYQEDPDLPDARPA